VITLASVGTVSGGTAGVEIRPPNVKFKLSAYDTFIDFATEATAYRITVGSGIVYFEDLSMGSYVADLIVSVQQADMTIRTFEKMEMRFDLVAPTGTTSLVKVSDGGRGGPNHVRVNGSRIPRRYSKDEFDMATAGWFYDPGAKIVYIKTVHQSVNRVLIDWRYPPLWVWIRPGAYEENVPENVLVEYEWGTYVAGSWEERENFFPDEICFLRLIVKDSIDLGPVSGAKVEAWANGYRFEEFKEIQLGVYEGFLHLVGFAPGFYEVDASVRATGYTDWHGETGFWVVERPVILPPVPPWWMQPWVWVAILLLISVVLISRVRIWK